MVDVCLSYNAYRDTMSILADGQPLNNISSLTKYQSQPFLAWCGEILDKLANEVNDEYALTYVGRACESRILAALSGRCRACRSFRPQSPALADPTARRLRKLHQLCMGGLTYTQFTESLIVYSDQDTEMLEGIFKGLFPKLCFCRIRVQYCPLAELGDGRGETLRFVIAGEQEAERIEAAVRGRSEETYVLLLSASSGVASASGRCIVERTTQDALSNLIGQYLELGFLMRILRRALSLITIDEKNPDYPAFAGLDKMEPQTCVRLPGSVETGQSLPIEVYTVPEGYPPAELQYRVSNPDVVQVKENTLCGVGTGEAVIEVYQAGQTVCVNRRRIVAHKRNRIQSMRMTKESLRLCVGDTLRLSVDYAPQDADNVSTIRYRSDDGLIASVIDGVLTARAPGSTTVRASTDDRVAAACSVRIYPRLEGLVVGLAQDELPFQGVTDVSVRRMPEDATLDELIYDVQPPELAVLDRGSMKLAARRAGSGRLVVTDRRRSVRAEVPFSVRPEKTDWGPVLKLLLGAAIVFGVIFMLTR